MGNTQGQFEKSFKVKYCPVCEKAWEPANQWVPSAETYEGFPIYGLPHEVCVHCTDKDDANDTT